MRQEGGVFINQPSTAQAGIHLVVYSLFSSRWLPIMKVLRIVLIGCGWLMSCSTVA